MTYKALGMPNKMSNTIILYLPVSLQYQCTKCKMLIVNLSLLKLLSLSPPPLLALELSKHVSRHVSRFFSVEFITLLHTCTCTA